MTRSNGPPKRQLRLLALIFFARLQQMPISIWARALANRCQQNGGSESGSNPPATSQGAARRFRRSPKVFWSVLKILYY